MNNKVLMAKENDITFYRFYARMRSFLSKLLRKPSEAEVPSFLEDNGITKKKLINDLLDRSVIERHEKILDSTNSDREKPTYSVTYKVKKKNFEKKMHRLYSKYFENDDKEELNECDCGGCLGGGGCFGDGTGEGSTHAGNANDNAPILPLGGVINRGSVYKDRDELKEPDKKKKKKKNIYLTESQVRYLNEFFNTKTIGDILEECEGATSTEIVNGNEVPRRSDKKKGIAGGVVFRTPDGKLDPAYDRKYKAN